MLTISGVDTCVIYCFIKYREERPFLIDDVDDVFVIMFLTELKELHFSWALTGDVVMPYSFLLDFSVLAFIWKRLILLLMLLGVVITDV